MGSRSVGQIHRRLAISQMVRDKDEDGLKREAGRFKFGWFILSSPCLIYNTVPISCSLKPKRHRRHQLAGKLHAKEVAYRWT